MFAMTVNAVYTQLKQENIWNIDQSVRDRFNATTMYESVMKQGIDWREWQSFVRDQITNHLLFELLSVVQLFCDCKEGAVSDSIALLVFGVFRVFGVLGVIGHGVAECLVHQGLVPPALARGRVVMR